MAFVQQPEVKWVETATFDSGTSYEVARGGPIEEGDQLVIIAGNAGTSNLWDSKTDWFQNFNLGSASAEVAFALYHRVADGTEPETETVNFGVDGGGAWVVYMNLGQRVRVSSTPLQPQSSVIVDASENALAVEAPAITTDTEKALVFLLAIGGVSGHTAFSIADDTWLPIADLQAGSGASGTVGLIATRPGTVLSFEGETVPAVTVTSNGTSERGWRALTLFARPKCGRTTAQVLDELLRFLPPEYVEATDLLGGIAAQISQLESVDGCDLFDLALVARGIDTWLTLHAQGLGIFRADGESDADLRPRIRNVDDRVTPPAILSAVQDVYGTVAGQPDALMIEWFDSGFADFAFADTLNATVFNGAPAFQMVVPDLGSGTFTEGTHQSVAALINDLRAAGVDVGMAIFQNVVLDSIPNRADPVLSTFLDLVGSPASGPSVGMDQFSLTDYGLVELTYNGHTNDRRLWGFKFRWDSTSPGGDQPLLGLTAFDGGPVLFVGFDGIVNFELLDSGMTSLGSDSSGTLTPDPNVDYWVFIAFNETNTGSLTATVAGGVDGAASLTFSNSFTVAAGTVALDTMALGANLVASGPGTVAAGEITLLEAIEWEAAFVTFDNTTMAEIAAGTNQREDRMIQRYNNLELAAGV